MNTNQRRFVQPSELENMEKFIDVHGQVLRFASPLSARREFYNGNQETPSRRFLSIAEGLGRSSITRGPLDDRLSDDDANKLWELICEGAAQLPPDRWNARWSTRVKTVEELDTLETLLMIAAVMAEGLQYSSGDARRLLGPPRQNEPRMNRWLRKTSIAMTSALKIATLDYRNPVWLAKRSLNGRLRVLCRHYAQILQFLFHAAKRATGRYDGAHVITAIGVPWYGSAFGHAWNWLVRSSSNKIIALDLTVADSALDRGQATSILNPGLDATRWTNASSFALRLLFEYLMEGEVMYRDARIRDALTSMFDPSTARGQRLLFNVLRTGWLGPRLQQHLTKHLADRGFLRMVPGWKNLLAVESRRFYHSAFGLLFKDQAVFDEVLHTLRGDRCDSPHPQPTRPRRRTQAPHAGTYDPWMYSMRSGEGRADWPTLVDDPK